MKHAGLKIALTVSAAVTFGLALAGCSGGSGEAPFDHIVTFDYNLGNMNTTIVNQYLGVMDNSLIAMAPGYDSNFKLQQLEGYEFGGWYLPKGYDKDGELLRNEDGSVEIGTEWNFKYDRVTEDITLYAYFAQKSQFTVIGKAEADGEIIDVKIDDTSLRRFERQFQGAIGQVFERPTTNVTASGYTFLEYYKDEALTEVFEWPYELQEGGVTIYAKFLEGTWAFVTTANQFTEALLARSNIMLMNDIDFSDVTWGGNYNYSGTIDGGGHRITGISYTFPATRTTSNYGLFGALGASFKVSRLTIENAALTFNVSVDPPSGSTFYVSAFASNIAEGATFEEFRFTGTLTVNKKNETTAVIPYEISHECSADLSGATFEVDVTTNINGVTSESN